MKEHSLSVAAVLAVLALTAGSLTAHAQTTTPTPSATPTPAPAACSVTTLPDSSVANCGTGAEPPPSFLGVSGGNYNSVATSKNGTTTCSTGTFGALVQDSSGKQYVLSSNHVLARTSGNQGSARVNEPIVQPGLVDLGCWQDPTDQVAKLSKWVPINIGGVNQFDAAIAEVVPDIQTPGGPSVPGIDPEGRILNIGQISTTPFPFDSLIDGLPVMKMGRGSCLTTGVIDAFDAMGAVLYPKTSNAASSGTAFFDHQVLVIGQAPCDTSGAACTFAAQSDSGALVLSYTVNFQCPQAIGIMFAAAPAPYGPDAGGQIVAVNPIDVPSPSPQGQVGILEKFKVTLVGDSTCTPVLFKCPSLSPGLELDAPSGLPAISDALRASIAEVRRVKDAHARNLLKNREIVAVGIGRGDAPDTAALKVYLRDDTPEIRNKVLSEIKNARVRFRHVRRFRAL